MANTETLPTDLDRLSDRVGRPAFPGCRPVHLPRAEIDRFEGRLEYWDGATAGTNDADFLAALRR